MIPPSPLEIIEAYDNLDEIRILFQEYTQSLGVDLGFQSYDEEYRSLPGKYSRPQGRLYLDMVQGQAAGCIALCNFDDARCEMKRLYVKPDHRGMAIGEKLILTIAKAAGEIGYTEILLDTLPWMKPAICLYEKLGFKEVERYYHNPAPGARYFSLNLRPDEGSDVSPGGARTL